MRFHYAAVLFCCFFSSLESTIGPGSRKSSSKSNEKSSSSTTAPTPQPLPVFNKPLSGSPPKSLDPVETNVFKRQLIEENLSAKSILQHHQSYCSTCVEKREFSQATLVYVTPWNSRGYDLAKRFAKKLDYISPVWLKIKRIAVEQYQVDGVQDIDEKWMEAVKQENPQVRFVPRVIFENWPVDHIHALFKSENEKQQLAATLKQFLIDNERLFDGYVVEFLMQFRGAPKAMSSHILSDIAEQIHSIETNRTRKEIILAVPPYDELFDKKDFDVLADILDGFSVMTYDFPNQEPGPVAPLRNEIRRRVNTEFVTFCFLFQPGSK